MNSLCLIAMVGILGQILATAAEPPLIVRQPSSQVIPPGGAVTLDVSATGTEPLVYQWLANGTNIPTRVHLVPDDA